MRKKLLDRQAIYSKFYDGNNKIIDQGIAIYFQAPASFTGEDVVEFQCHGNPIISDLILKSLCEAGARLATPGEFTLRAFLNNKINLTQAEAIADLINSVTEKNVRTANKSLQGQFSNHIKRLLQRLIEIRLNVEAHLDFPDEDIDTHKLQDVNNKIFNAVSELESIQQNARRGERLHTGTTIAIAGKPNVGKSSLINKLSQSDIAIVTKIPGTTRDPLTADIEIQGVPIRLVDTAGLRDTDNVIEKIGIERTQEILAQADIILWLTDASKNESQNKIYKDLPNTSHHIVVHNKVDLVANREYLKNNRLYVSATTGEGLELLVKAITKYIISDEQGDVPFLARNRHLIALKKTSTHLQAAHDQMENNNKELEIVAEELRLAQQSLGEITGEFTADDLLGRIFSEFCIGK